MSFTTASLGIRRSIVNKEHMHPKRKFCPYASTAFQQVSGSLRLNAVIAVTSHLKIILAFLSEQPWWARSSHPLAWDQRHQRLSNGVTPAGPRTLSFLE